MLKRWTVFARALDSGDDWVDVELEATGNTEDDAAKVVEGILALYRYRNVSVRRVVPSEMPEGMPELPEFRHGCATWDEQTGGSEPLPARPFDRPEVLYFTVTPVEESGQDDVDAAAAEETNEPGEQND